MERISRRSQVAATAAGRLGLALLISAGLHVLFAVRVEVGVPGGQWLPAIHARLDLDASPAIPRPPRAPAPLRSSAAPSLPAVAVEPPEPPLQSRRPDIDPPPPVADASPPPVQVPVDPVYYAARELDLYPTPIEPLRALPTSQTRGWVRVLALVDETGTVTQAEIFDSDPPGAFDQAAVDAVSAARFSPARREGRAVRSRVLIELGIGGAEE